MRHSVCGDEEHTHLELQRLALENMVLHQLLLLAFNLLPEIVLYGQQLLHARGLSQKIRVLGTFFLDDGQQAAHLLRQLLHIADARKHGRLHFLLTLLLFLIQHYKPGILLLQLLPKTQQTVTLAFDRYGPQLETPRPVRSTSAPRLHFWQSRRAAVAGQQRAQQGIDSVGTQIKRDRKARSFAYVI